MQLHLLLFSDVSGMFKWPFSTFLVSVYLLQTGSGKLPSCEVDRLWARVSQRPVHTGLYGSVSLAYRAHTWRLVCGISEPVQIRLQRGDGSSQAESDAVFLRVCPELLFLPLRTIFLLAVD